MEIYKIAKAKYACLLTASGNEGRWNYRGQEVIYTASSRALASLEVMVHLSAVRLKSDSFNVSVIHVPDHVSVQNITYEDIPAGWNGMSRYALTQPLGSAWLRAKETCLLRVPSSIILNEFNFLVNPNHPDIKKLKIVDVENFLYDQRLLEAVRQPRT